MLGTIAWHSGPFTGAVESGPKCDADSTVASWLIAVEEAFKGMGEVTSYHSLRVSEQLGGEVCVEEFFWKLEDNGSMIVQELWKGVGGQACVNGRETSSEAMRPEPISAPS